MIGAALDALHERLLAAVGPGAPTLTIAVGRARAIADGLVEQARLEAAGEAFAGPSLAALAAAGRITPAGVTELLDDARRLTGAEPLSVALFALADPAPLTDALDTALHAHVTLIAGAAAVPQVAAWRVPADGAPQPAAESAPGAFEATRAAVAQVFCRDARDLPLVIVHDGDEPAAILAWAPREDEAPAVRALAERSGASLSVALERHALLVTELAEHADAARAAKRRLARVAFDLHDGPLQDLALMRQELNALRRELRELGMPARRSQLRLDDVLAIADSTETDLRELATSMTSSTLTQRPFADALRGVLHGFGLRSGLEPQLDLHGEPDGLTAMERVALLRVIGEALANVREHSGAQNVVVAVRIGAADVEADVVDDGCGFDVQTALPAAARRGSMGLLGIIERIRLMNGSWDVLSTVGQGTTVSVRFDRFLPAQAPAELQQPGAVSDAA